MASYDTSTGVDEGGSTCICHAVYPQKGWWRGVELLLSKHPLIFTTRPRGGWGVEGG